METRAWQYLLVRKWAGNEGKWATSCMGKAASPQLHLGRSLLLCAAFPDITLMLSFSLQINGPLQKALSPLCSNIFFKRAEEKFGLR